MLKLIGRGAGVVVGAVVALVLLAAMVIFGAVATLAIVEWLSPLL